MHPGDNEGADMPKGEVSEGERLAEEVSRPKGTGQRGKTARGRGLRFLWDPTLQRVSPGLCPEYLPASP